MFIPATLAGSGANALSHPVKRVQPRNGFYRTIAIITTFAMLFGGLLLMPTAAVAASAATTARLNFRGGPSLGDSVMWVLSSGDAVELTGQQSNGYWQAVVDGTTGWLAADYLTTSGAPSSPDPEPDSGNGDGSVPVGDSVTGTATVTSGLNLRSGPSTDYGVVTVMPGGASVELRGDPQGGYYPLSYNGTMGWAHGDWLRATGSSPAPDPAPGDNGGGSVPVGDGVTGSATVTSALNLRTGPSTDYEVRTVMPSGASVELRGDPQGAYFPLSYNGTSGWAHGDWLRAGGASPDPAPSNPDPDPDQGDGATPQYLYTAASVNMRSGPSVSDSVVWVIPPNTRVTI